MPFDAGFYRITGPWAEVSSKEGKSGITKTRSLCQRSRGAGMGFAQGVLEMARRGQMWDRSIVNRAKRFTDGLNVKHERKKGNKDVTGSVAVGHDCVIS